MADQTPLAAGQRRQVTPSAPDGAHRPGGLDELLDGMSRIEFTLRFTLSHPDLDTTIVGTKDVAHLRGNIEIAKNGPLPPDVVAEAKRRMDATESRPQ